MTETRTLEEFRAKFRVKELKILENRSWPEAAICNTEIYAWRMAALGAEAELRLLQVPIAASDPNRLYTIAL